ncbi:MAG: phosphate signaling complex protein PhoU [Clostridia bacterium]|nr:phosphate signaling complex protein PhoU [Clostridia bacterium]
MRDKFNQQLEKLNQDLIEMGGLIENSIAGAVTAITSNDKELAKKILEADSDINHKEREIEGLCLNLLLKQQPVASDLRLISAALKMITDMERIGDQASDICEIELTSEFIANAQMPDPIKDMAKHAINMVNMSIEAFVKKDMQMAQGVKEEDEIVDNLFRLMRSDLIESIRQNTSGDEQAIDVFMIAKYLEKIADHAVNVAGWVIFSMTGEHIDKIINS